jgi:hypothetical protein
MKTMRKILACLALLAFLVPVVPAGARLGGGGSFSSGRRSYSSRPAPIRPSYNNSRPSYNYSRPSYQGGGGSHVYVSGGGYSGGGGGDIGVVIILLAFLFFLVVAAFAAMAFLKMMQRGGQKAALYADPGQTVLPADGLGSIRQDDANFSEPAFREFAGLLFERLHEARGTQSLETLAAYVQDALLDAARDSHLSSVGEVLVGACRLSATEGATQLPANFHGIVVEYEATYTTVSNNHRAEFYAVERWLFGRAAHTLSKDPEAILNLGCPSCGNPGQIGKDGRCPYCDQVVNRGTFQWKVFSREVLKQVPKPPMEIDTGGEEIGADYPTVYQQNFPAHQRTFETRHPEFKWDELRARIIAIFLNLQAAWSSLDFDKARPFETDVLFDTHRFWIERYKSSGVRNALSQVEVTRVLPVRIDSDAFYEIFTVRIFAKMIDVTVDAHGKVLGGNPNKPRVFSEYWTFIRRIGKGTGKTDANLQRCPQCGAELKISQVGVCEYCGAKVTSGEFDWVLSAIDQDEAYGQA